MNRKEKEQIISDLREKKINCIIGTSLLDEGLDFPSDFSTLPEKVKSQRLDAVTNMLLGSGTKKARKPKLNLGVNIAKETKMW